MSWQCTSWAASIRVGNPTLKLLLLVLGNFANESGECWYSQKRISMDSEIPERTLRRKLSELVDMGLIEIEERRREDGSRLNNFVRLMVQQPAILAACSESATGQISNRPKTGVTTGQKPGSPPATMVAAIKESISNHQLELDNAREEPGDGWPDDFLDQFWSRYPPGRKQDKPEVLKKLMKIRASKKVPWVDLMDGLDRFRATMPEPRFTAAPMVWLNNERWNAEYIIHGGANEANRNGGGKVGFSGLAARLRQGIRESEFVDRGCAPEDLRPVNGR